MKKSWNSLCTIFPPSCLALCPPSTPSTAHPHPPTAWVSWNSVQPPPHPVRELRWIPRDSPGTSGEGLRIMKASDRPALTGCWEELISRTGIGICGRRKEAPSTPPPPPKDPWASLELPSDLQMYLPAQQHLSEDSKTSQIQWVPIQIASLSHNFSSTFTFFLCS